MAIEIKVPRLGWTMEEGIFRGWLKKEGDLVQAGEPLFSLEGDKAVQEVEAPDSGRLHFARGGPKEGDEVLVGALLGYLAAEGEAFCEPATTTGSSPALSVSPTRQPAVAAPVVEASRRQESAAIAPAITPRARQAAARLEVDWTGLKGSGRNGRIRERDILGAAHDRPETTSDPSRIRRLIADRMRHSLQTTAPVTLTTTVDATELVALRNRHKLAEGAVPTVTDLLVWLVAPVLQKHPALNSRWVDGRIVSSAEVNIGVAVDTEGGLLVPVIRDAAKRSLTEIAARSAELVAKARSGGLSADELQGGTFTITNLGRWGIDEFTPIINWPECAILGVGRIRKQPAVVGDQIVPRDLLTLSLTFDHRIVDGAPAARFLQDLSHAIEAAD